MLAELRQKAQITIPKDIVAKLGLSEGDKLEISERDGTICMTPVKVYPKKYIKELWDELNNAKAKISSREQVLFQKLDAMFKDLIEDEK